MRNTFSDLSSRDKGFPEVEVLLATFNGELFLAEFLDSLSRQNDVRIHLRVSDDGSSDKTVEIINSHKHLFETCIISSGPCLGPSANFFSLIEHATYEFVALADQDDIWLPHHLISAINRLSKTPDLPSMTFSTVAEFTEEKETETIWPKRFPGEDIRTIITENLARGCTFVLNTKAINLIKIHKPKNAIMHDWWILLLIYSSGSVTWSKLPEVRYRIHKGNAVGGKPSFRIRLNRFLINFKGRDWKVVSQVNELLYVFGWSMSGQKRHEIGSFLRDINSPLSTGRWGLLLWAKRFRTNLYDELAVRLGFLMHKRQKKGAGTLGILIYHRLRQLMSQFTFFIATLKIRIRNFIDYRITKKFYQHSVAKKVQNISIHGVAIVALYPRAGILKSVERLVDSLISSNYSVIVVLNQSPLVEEWSDLLSKKPIEILRRPNIGRDFGAFKIGFIHAEKNGYLKSTDRLLFANDSVFYGPKSVEFVVKMLSVDLPWHSMFVNYQFHAHAQSFFQVFDKNIFQNKRFSEFWHNYYPSELRHHAINNGEVGLSNTCLRLGFSPVSYVSANSILENSEFGEFTPDEKFGIWSNHGLTFLNQDLSSLENTSFLMKRQYLENNVTHHQGLLASRVLKSPLKLDIFQSGQTTIEGIRNTLISLGLTEDELKTVLQLMTLKGSHASRKGFNRLWGSYGYV
jgi:glycosyltransferase involved in cell wall biosynthesis